METLQFSLPWLMGIIAAILHVLSGPDHLAAVTPLVLEKNEKHWKIGFSWGIGHITGMLLIGVLLYFFKELIPVDKISNYGEQFVGFLLIGIGLWAIYRIKFESKINHSHPHVHVDKEIPYAHIHKHGHEHIKHGHSHPEKIQQNNLMAMSIGIIHGFAGISHFLIMLPVLGYKSHIQSLEYITGFGVGTIIAMVFFTYLIGRFSKSTKYEPVSWWRDFRYWGAALAIFVGVFWIGSTF